MLFRSPRDRRWAVLFSMRQRHKGTEAVQATSVSVGERRADASGRLFRLLYAARPLLREQSRDKIGAESGHVGVPRQQAEVKVMHRFREGADVDALCSQSGPHRRDEPLGGNPDCRGLARRKVRQLVDVSLGLQDDVAADQPGHPVIGEPVFVLVDRAAWRSLSTGVDLAGEALCYADLSRLRLRLIESGDPPKVT